MNTVLMLSLLMGLIAVNAFFVLAEFVSISVTPVQLEQECKEHKWARNLHAVLSECSLHALIQEIRIGKHERYQNKGCCRQIPTDSGKNHKGTDNLNQRYGDVLRAMMQ